MAERGEIACHNGAFPPLLVIHLLIFHTEGGGKGTRAEMSKLGHTVDFFVKDTGKREDKSLLKSSANLGLSLSAGIHILCIPVLKYFD